MDNSISSGKSKDAIDLFRNPILKALDDEGITDEYLAKLLKREMESEVTKPFLGPKGEVIYSKGLTAWEIRQRARMDALKILDRYPSEKHIIEGSLSLRNLSDEELETRIEKILKKDEEKAE